MEHSLKNPQDVIDYLTYCSYKHNRSTGLSAEGARRIFGPQADALEAHYQREGNYIFDSLSR